jgi:hypothetical protein
LNVKIQAAVGNFGLLVGLFLKNKKQNKISRKKNVSYEKKIRAKRGE